MDRYIWSRLNHLQVGRYAEYYVKMEFTIFGFDVYSSEVDDKGIDFVIRRGLGSYYDVQVKSVRIGSSGYIFFPKHAFALRPNLLAAVAIFRDGQSPSIYLIPSIAWSAPDGLLVSRDYPGSTKSKPEWGLNISARNQHLLDRFAFEAVAQTL
jgi:hypothetical protein